MLAARMGGGCQPPTRGGCWLPTVWGIGSPLQEGKPIDPCVAKIEFGKAGEVEDITKKVKGIVSCAELIQRKIHENSPKRY